MWLTVLGVCALANLSLAGSLSEGIPSEFTDDYQSYSSGVVMVRFDLEALENREGLSGPRTPQARLMAAAQEILPGIQLRRDLTSVVDGLVSLSLPTTVGVQEAVHLFCQSQQVICAEPSYKYRLAGVPDDPSFGAQWSLHTDTPAGAVDVDINAPEAWDIRTDANIVGEDGVDSRIIVAVLDTGVDYTHEDLIDNLWSRTVYYIPEGVVHDEEADPPFDP